MIATLDRAFELPASFGAETSAPVTADVEECIEYAVAVTYYDYAFLSDSDDLVCSWFSRNALGAASADPHAGEDALLLQFKDRGIIIITARKG